MNQLQVYKFEKQDVRTRLIDESPWFVGRDVANILGYKNPSDALLRHVEPEDRGVAEHDTLGGKQTLVIINESGLYSLILKSNLPAAKRFKRWVTSEVLPAIRKTGGYQVPRDARDALRLMFEATEQTQEEVDQVKQRVNELEENASLTPGEYNYVSKRVSQKVFQIGRERSYNMNKYQKKELFKALNSEIASITGIKTRSQLKVKHFDQVIEFIDDWEPSKATTVRVKQLDLLTEERGGNDGQAFN